MLMSVLVLRMRTEQVIRTGDSVSIPPYRIVRTLSEFSMENVL